MQKELHSQKGHLWSYIGCGGIKAGAKGPSRVYITFCANTVIHSSWRPFSQQPDFDKLHINSYLRLH